MLLLGESGKQATCYHLEKTFRLKRDAWHKNPEAFAEAVEQMFGSGSQLLLKAVVKELYTNLGLKFQESNQFSFVHLVRQAQRYSGGGGKNLIERRKCRGKRERRVGNIRRGERGRKAGDKRGRGEGEAACSSYEDFR
jgi:hypothetical protein